MLGLESTASRIAHVSVNAKDLAASVDFYVDVFGAEPVATRTVEELEPVYRRAEARGAFDFEAFGNHLVELPGDMAQTYLRDPAGNLVEIDTPGASRLPEALRSQLERLEDMRPQTPENMSARLDAGGAS